MVRGGAFARDLENCRTAALTFFDRIKSDPRFLTGLNPELDIIVWTIRAGKASEASRLNHAVFEASAAANLHLAKANLPKELFEGCWGNFNWDQDYITCLRSVLMKPESLEWINGIWATFSETVDRVLHESGS
jgi:hypothetical protein